MHEVHRPQIRLLEVLVVVACVGVLIGIFMPAITYPGRGSNTAVCQNNLRQIVLAAANFESSFQKLPANRQFRKSSRGISTVGWVYDLLPYLEQQPAYDLLKRDADDGVANTIKIPLLICPQDSTISHPTDTSYMANGGCPNNPSDNFDAAANGVGNDLAGPFSPQERATSSGCKDGTSSTIYYVENLNAQRWNEDFFHPTEQNREYFHTVNWLPMPESDLSGGFQVSNAETKRRFLWGINEGDFEAIGPEFARPSSGHPGGFQAAFVGCNVRFIRETIDYRVYAQLLSSNGEETLDPEDASEERTREIRLWQGINLIPQSYE